MTTRFIRLAIVVVLLASACTPTTGSSTTAAPETTTTAAPETTTTATSVPEDEITAPETGDPDDVALDALWAAGDFGLAGAPTLFELDALEAIKRWLPEDIVEGLVWKVFSDTDDASVVAVSVIPTLTWRGDPNFVPALVATLTDADIAETEDGIYRAVTDAGLIVPLWSTGDGFVVAASLDEGVSVDYLKALASEAEPHTVWASGACLYIDPETEALPYAPFPPDIVVPCDGPHNAEVLLALQVSTELSEFDSEAIEYDRNYVCDRAYEGAFGPRKDRTPMLVTYMPDEDEWDRGDRYLACVVQIETTEGPLLFSGAMADRTDLMWNPEVGTCLDVSFASVAVECSARHGYQYLGEAEVTFDDWPPDGPRAFEDACVDLIGEFVLDGPADVEVFATGLFPFAFEEGDRTVRCMAFAIEDGLLVEVVGSFDGSWRVIGGGIAT